MKNYFLLFLALMTVSRLLVAEQLPGFQRSLEAASHEADVFCLAYLEDEGRPDAGPPETMYYSNARVKVIRNLRVGKIAANKWAYALQKTSSEDLESFALGKPFLVIGKEVNGEIRVLKIAEPTNDNVEVLKKAMRDRGLDVVGTNEKSSIDADFESKSSSAPKKIMPLINPQTSKKASEAKPTPLPSEELTSSTPWSIIVVLIVAATGLLWLLVKKRK